MRIVNFNIAIVVYFDVRVFIIIHHFHCMTTVNRLKNEQIDVNMALIIKIALKNESLNIL